MECAVCEVRSSVGYCIECQKLLCETCSTPCEQCGKLCCEDHAYETRSGRILCVNCYGEREEKRARVKAAKTGKGDDETSFGALEGVDAPPEAEGEGAALVASAARTVEPWKVSLITASVGLLVMLVVAFVPALRSIPLLLVVVPTPLVLLIIPLIALFWGVYGYFREEFYENRPKCLAGVGIAGLTILIAVASISNAPVDEERKQIETVAEQREEMTKDDVKGYREQVLQRFQQ
ncbi:MAG: hypothetical protein AMXMBFR84_01110 [Candidatus Hydrogenedentota bacterium]